MKNSIISYLKKHPNLRYIVRYLLLQYRKIKYLLIGFGIKVEPNLIIFECYMGRKYTCNPKALYLELLNNEKYSSYKFVWAFKNPEEFKFLENGRTKVIKYGSKEYKQTYHKAKYFITNSRLPEWIIKKKNQVYIQTWHGTPLKKLGYDIKVKGNNAMNSKKEIQDKYYHDSKRYDYMISPSEFCTEKFKSAFNLKSKTKVVEKGYPRNDQLFKYDKKDIIKIKNELGIPKDKKVILYAPTWRDNKHQTGLGYIDDNKIDFDLLKEKLSDDYIILFRSHYFIANTFDFSKYKNFIYDVSMYNEINDLYIISDLLITDYSSVFFDYANLKRPMIFYMYDYSNYKHNLRDFYIELDELPGVIIKEKNDELLCDMILNYKKNNQKYVKKYKEFNQKFNYLDNKNCSREVLKECNIKSPRQRKFLILNIFFKVKSKNNQISLKALSLNKYVSKKEKYKIDFSKLEVMINDCYYPIKFYLKKGIPFFRHYYLNYYEIIIPEEEILTFDIQNKISILYDDVKGRIMYSVFDLHHGKERNSKIIIKDNQSIYFRQSIKNSMYLTIRESNEYDYKKSQIKIFIAYMLSKFLFYKNITLFFEKESSRYEESASCVYEKFIDQGCKNCYYLLNKENPVIDKLEKKYQKNIIETGTLKHLIYFFATKNFISTETLGHAVKLRIANRLVRRKIASQKNKYVFLQHGVMYMVSLNSDLRVGFQKPNMKLYRVVVSSKKEAEHFIQYSNYKMEDFYITGLAKFDKAIQYETADKIVIMPTWRRWETNIALTNFSKTKYYKMMERIVDAIPKEFHNKIIVLPHPLMLEAMKKSNCYLKNMLVDKSYDDILKECKVLITDYSSISYDAFYRGSNIIFYWEEKEECLKHYGDKAKIMLDKNLAFGDICYNPVELTNCFDNNYNNKQQVKYQKRYKKIVTYHDNKNTDRIVECIKGDMKVN